MENEFFLSAGAPPPTLFEPQPATGWQALSSAMELHCQSEQSGDCFLGANWDKPADQNPHFDSALSSIVSSPAASNSSDSFVIRELIGKLGNIGSSGEISPPSQPQTLLPTHAYAAAPKLALPALPLNSTVADFSADPGFAERAAKFSCFGSRSFNGRTAHLGALTAPEFQFRSNPVMGNAKLSRVSSSPSLKTAASSQVGAQENKNSSPQDPTEFTNSQEESTLSEHKPAGDANPRKRKAVPRGKPKETPRSSSPSPSPSPSTHSPAAKVPEANDESNAKRCKTADGDGNENDNAAAKAEQDQKSSLAGDDKEKQGKSNAKPPEPPKDYIHVRARRGQATDSHSLAERVRREKISERMKLLQDLVPGCNKVTGKALMLDEIINYVQSLQRQVEFLSMKLASVNTRLDFNVDTLVSKDMHPPGCSFPHPIFPLDSSASGFYGHQPLHTTISSAAMTQCSAEPLDSTLCQTLGMQMTPLRGFNEGLAQPQYSTFCQDELQTIVQMGFGKNPNQEAVALQGPIQVSQMKIEH